MSTSGKKLSGAQQRKRQKKFHAECKTSRNFMNKYFKKAEPDDHSSSDSAHDEVDDIIEQNLDKSTDDSATEQHGSESNEDSGRCEASRLQDTSQTSEMETIVHADSMQEVNEGGESSTADVAASICSTVFELSDIGYLDFDASTKLPTISDELRRELVSRGPAPFQNKDKVGKTVAGVRSMTDSWFVRRLANGENLNRTWLLYSQHKKAAFCFCCLLFPSSTSNSHSSFESMYGFRNWRHTEKVANHEGSPSHRKSFTLWKDMEYNLSANRLIEEQVCAQIKNAKQKWREVLKRLLSCIKFLATQNLALRGHTESVDGSQAVNTGNFLAILKLLSEYDTCMAGHLKYVAEHPGSVSYLSPQIQNEFIAILASTVKREIISGMQRNRYYGLLLDSTPDFARREQMSVTLRYVNIDYTRRQVSVEESFIGFTQLHAKDAASIEEAITGKLEAEGIALADCRAQCFDNAAVMAGHISGLQQRITESNPLALFINCDNHSLNLAGVHAAKEDSIVVTFFGTAERIYSFFSTSTIRWEEMKTKMKSVVKRECETRWSSRADAVKALFEELDVLIDILECLSENTKHSAETRGDAAVLLQSILSFNFVVLLNFWHHLLSSINRVQKRLQDPAIDFHNAALDLQALDSEFDTIRDGLCQESIDFGKAKCEELGIQVGRRVRKKKCMPGEIAQDAGLTAEEEIERVMKAAIDRLRFELSTRFKRLKELDAKFGFLLSVQELFGRCTVPDTLLESCIGLAKFYETDINGRELFCDICDCRMLLNTRQDNKPQNPLQLLSFLISYGEDVFPNLRIALQILLTVGTSIASCERSFSKLKLILSYLRSSMSQERLNDLTLLSVERETFSKLDFEDVIDKFAAQKARKVLL